MKRTEIETDRFELSGRPFNKPMFEAESMDAVERRVWESGSGRGVRKPVNRRRLYMAGTALTTLIIFCAVLFMGPLSENTNGTIRDVTTPLYPQRVEAKEGLMLVDDYSMSMAGQKMEYYSGGFGRLVVDPKIRTAEQFRRGDVLYYRLPSISGFTPNPDISGSDSQTARVIGLPGEKIKIEKGRVYVNGKKLDTFYGQAKSFGLDEAAYFKNMKVSGRKDACPPDCVKDTEAYFNTSMAEMEVPAGALFVLGDFWAQSHDSREFGALAQGNIQGKVLGYDEAGARSPSQIFASGNLWFTGIPGKIGIVKGQILTSHFSKIVWHFWGSREEFEGKKLRIEGIHTSDGVKKPVLVSEDDSIVWEYKWGPTYGPVNGADATQPTGIKLDESGQWRLDFYLGGKFFASMFVNAE
ncbi:signal peptidase I [Paenibacillus sp. 1P03SA]|uniref:signal peptidase I n=1 Tax=Paenibacillus sp. 1P03SA TaxID=3132294 RepID=UPI00399FD60F